MSIRSLTQLVVGMAFALVLLTACGDVGNVNIDGNDWPNWPWPWPINAPVVVDKTLSGEVPVEDHRRIRLDAVNGEITITGQPGADSVTVTAKLRVGSFAGRDDAQEGLDQLDVRVTDRSDEIFVQTLQPQDTQGRQYVVHYTITVPSDLEVVVDQDNGRISVVDVESSVDVDVTNGDVDGTIGLRLNSAIRFSTVNGNLDLRIPASTSATFAAFVVHNGSITRDNFELKDEVQTNQSLTGILGDGAGEIELETTNGVIHVTGLIE